MLEIGVRLLRSETELVLKSRRVVPGRLLESGFTFEYPEWMLLERSDRAIAPNPVILNEAPRLILFSHRCRARSEGSAACIAREPEVRAFR